MLAPDLSLDKSISIGNFVTWGLIVLSGLIGWLLGVERLRSRVLALELYRVSHEPEAQTRDRTLIELRLLDEKLTIIQAAMERRLQIAEQWVVKHDDWAHTEANRLTEVITVLREIANGQERRLKFLEDRCERTTRNL